MKKVTQILATLTLILFAASANAQNHEEHHQAAKVEEKAPAKAEKEGMMGHMNMKHMNMDEMHNMMKECMGMHKDGKMCEHKTMEMCQGKMKKSQCQKMMKQSKALDKQEATK